VSHLLASAKTGDRILAVTIPPAAEKLRRLLNLAQITQSHALSFFHLSSPDFLLGWDSDPAKRNIFGLIAADPELARGGIRLRQFGQDLIERLGGRKIHAAWAVPGGVRTPLDPVDREAIRARLPPSPTPRWNGSRGCWMARWRRRPARSAVSRRCLWAWWGLMAAGSTTTASCA
jgi:NAD-reducing hydrogenase large subunit